MSRGADNRRHVPIKDTKTSLINKLFNLIKISNKFAINVIISLAYKRGCNYQKLPEFFEHRRIYLTVSVIYT